MSNDGGPAFPDLQRLQMCKATDLNAEQRETVYVQSSGMKLRDYFAAAALPLMFRAPRDSTSDAAVDAIRFAAVYAYRIADEMIKERAE